MKGLSDIRIKNSLGKATSLRDRRPVSRSLESSKVEVRGAPTMQVGIERDKFNKIWKWNGRDLVAYRK